MAGRPMTAVRVGNLARSLAFYQEVLGCAVAERPGPDLATVDLFGYPVLLAGPDAGDPRPHLHDVHEVFEGRATLHAFHADLDRLAADLEARGARDLERVERPWGDRLLAVPDPDGHRVAFWTEVARSPEEIVALYAEGPAALERALAGLDGADLDLARAPGAWTIRQIVHHVADSDATSLS
ncbi:MAG: VOC family protein, partial [Thermomicrobiaceae bacterium]|nr:VOC family protein [Thermomicrobiaceae bacterium]